MNNALYSQLFPGDMLRAHLRGQWSGFKLDPGKIIFILSRTDQLRRVPLTGIDYYRCCFSILIDGVIHQVFKRNDESYSYMLERI
jgi:hypothetical protein